ncbi:hypothetical protein CONLIGDRAFT_226407 [Coniochaeta ligniaria NRRL 30616]|uniref:Uncharacterized protein n=1 Tax=Coniochaeta ligniaria NRRL 30616 TaxID=1408157 RepID=A0A1J7I4N5_9PEZI|nr:hypothetical protein CONLIGDRAFT_226407 [Coniochaeta ligniaria NRRL 30616]
MAYVGIFCCANLVTERIRGMEFLVSTAFNFNQEEHMRSRSSGPDTTRPAMLEYHDPSRLKVQGSRISLPHLPPFVISQSAAPSFVPPSQPGHPPCSFFSRPCFSGGQRRDIQNSVAFRLRHPVQVGHVICCCFRSSSGPCGSDGGARRFPLLRPDPSHIRQLRWRTPTKYPRSPERLCSWLRVAPYD